MAGGMILAALAFGAAAFVEWTVVQTVVESAPPGDCLLQVFNLVGEGRDVTLKIPDNSDLFTQPIKYLEDPPEYVRLPLGQPSKEVKMEMSSGGIGETPSECTQNFTSQAAYTLIVFPRDTGLVCKLVKDDTIKSSNGDPYLRFINTQPRAVTITVGGVEFDVGANYSVSNNSMTVPRDTYAEVKVCNSTGYDCSNLNLGLLDFGASYSVIVFEISGKMEAKTMEDVKANNVHIAWQIPQYVLMTAGEVMFSITGLEFSYSQAPANMKSVLQAGWLLTVAFGNIIVLIVAEGAGLDQWVEFLLFAMLLVAVCIIFSIMAYFYTYVDPDEIFKDDLELKAKDDHEDDDDQDLHKNNKQTDDEEHLNRIESSTKM